MLRFMVEIKSAETGPTSVEPDATTQTASTPPPEVAAAAAALGATNAGPAPAAPQGVGVPPLPVEPIGSVARAAGPGDTAAGAAPGSSVEPPAVVIEEEGTEAEPS